MSDTTIEIQLRDTDGTPAVRKVRKEGLIPGVLYGTGREPLAFKVDVPQMRRALTGDAGRHAILEVTIPGEKKPVHAIVKDLQLHKVRDRVIHIDLLAINMSEPITASVAVVIDGEAIGVRSEGGVLEQHVTEIEVTALPADLPDAIHVDVSELTAGSTIKLGELTPPAGVRWSSDEDTMLAGVVIPRVAVETEEEEGEEPSAADVPAQHGGDE